MGFEEEAVALLSLAGKAAVVTGGASGIGLATAGLLARAGAVVALLDIDGEAGAAAAATVTAEGGTARHYACDVTVASQCRSAVASVLEDFGGIDVLFNNAGIIRRKDIVETVEKDWDAVIGVNLKGVYLMCHFVIPHMIRQGGGCIVNNGSGWSLKGGPRAASYCASKGAIPNLTRALAIDHGRDNIRVNCVCPGDTDTALLHSEAAQLEEDDAKFMREAAARPLGRVGTPEDVARAVLFLASEMSGWITGAVLVVDGGGLA